MDAYTLLNSYASPDFASTTGVSMAQITGYASSTSISLLGGVMDFLHANIAQITVYTIIALVLLVPVNVFIFYHAADR